MRRSALWLAGKHQSKELLGAFGVPFEQFNSGKPDHRLGVGRFAAKGRFEKFARARRIFCLHKNQTALDAHNGPVLRGGRM